MTLHNNPGCVEQIEAFKACHEDNSYWMKLFGACNQAKLELDQCFRAQKKVKAKASIDKARESTRQWRQACAELDEGPRGG